MRIHNKKSLLLLLFILIFHFSLYPQQKEKTSNNGFEVDYKEKKIIDDAFDLYKNFEKEKAYQIAHKLLRRTKNYYSKTHCNLLIGQYFNGKSQMDSSFFYTNRALKLRNHIKNDSLLAIVNAMAYNTLGVNYLKKGLLEEAKKWHIRGIEAAERFKEKRLYYINTHGLAQAYNGINDHKKALTLFKKCLEYKEYPRLVYGSYINIGSIYNNDLKDFETSNFYLKKAITLCEKVNDAQCLTSVYANLGYNYEQLGNIDKAIEILHKAKEIADENDLHRLSLKVSVNIAKVLMRQNRYEEAKAILFSILPDAVELGFLNEQQYIFDKVKEIAVEQENYQEAFEAISMYYKVKDSIDQLQKDKEIRELEIKYNTLQKEKEIKELLTDKTNRDLELKNQKEAIKNLKLKQQIAAKENENKILTFQNASEKKQNEITLLQKDKELQNAKLTKEKSTRNIILYSSIAILVPVIALLIVYHQKLSAQKELHKKEKEINDLKLIQASIEGQEKERTRISEELHDSICGNLAAIKLQLNNTTINRQVSKELGVINKQLDTTYHQVRNLSHNLISNIGEANFCDTINEYFTTVFDAANIEVSFLVYPRMKINKIDENIQREIFIIIQELITNVIKHANAYYVELQLNLIDDVVNLYLEDNGVGFDVNKDFEGIGFKNIRSRLKKISGELDIDTVLGRGTIIIIEIPVITKSL